MSTARILRRVGSGIVSVGIGIAVQLSALRGALAEAVAWLAVALGIALFLFGLLPFWSSRRTRASRQQSLRDMRMRVGTLGTEIVRFKIRRDVGAPTEELSRVSAVRHPVLATRERHDRQTATEAYARDTVELYLRRFGASVRAIVRELCACDRLGAHEAKRLIAPPEGPAAVEQIGLKLMELGRVVD